MSRALDDLSSDMRPRAVEVLARLTERGIAVVIVDTLRSSKEQEEFYKRGVSKTKLSRHLPRYLRTHVPANDLNWNKADAIDLCPYSVYALHGEDKLQWDAQDPVWRIIAEIGEGEGLVSGFRWRDPFDPGHLELPRSVWET